MAELSTDLIVRQTGMTFRQIDYWCRQGYLRTENKRTGTGVHRVFSLEEAAVARMMAELVRCGFKPESACKLARGDSDLLRKIQVVLSALRVSTGVTDSPSRT